MKIKDIIEEYKYQNDYINSLNVTKNENVKGLFLGYLISLLIVLIPTIITLHFVLTNYNSLLLAILLVLATIFLGLGEIFHHKFLKNFSKDKRKVTLVLKHIIDTVAYLLMFTFSYIVVLILF